MRTPLTAQSPAGVGAWISPRSPIAAAGAHNILLEGPPEAVDAVSGYVRRGPSSARVEHVESHDETPEGLDGFEIR